MRTIWVVVTLVATVLAGCSDPAPAEATDDEGFDVDVQATEDTGVIRGVVVDGSVVPVAGADVRLQNHEEATTTNEEGQFAFGDLSPGTYFVVVAAYGYDEVQTSVDVVAGVDQPPVVRIVIQAIEGFNPFSQTQTHEGFYQCGLSFLVVCGAPNVLLGDGTTDDTSTPTLRIQPGAQYVQTEMVWESTQQVSPKLLMEMEALDDGCTGDALLNRTEGESPIRATVNASQVKAGSIGGDECGIYHSVFAGDITGRPHCFLWDPVPLVKCGAGFALQQRFTFILTEYHGYQPPTDWWYIEDGEHPPPM